MPHFRSFSPLPRGSPGRGGVSSLGKQVPVQPWPRGWSTSPVRRPRQASSPVLRPRGASSPVRRPQGGIFSGSEASAGISSGSAALGGGFYSGFCGLRGHLLLLRFGGLRGHLLRAGSEI